MPTVIELKDGKVKTLFSDKDFEELVDKYMGYDAMRYFRQLMDDWDDDAESKERDLNEAEQEIDDLKDELEQAENEIDKLERRIDELEEELEGCDRGSQ